MSTIKIYTKTGDKGETSLFGGKRVSKADLRVETYGTVDELNSMIGVIIAEMKNAKVKKELTTIQNDLLDLGSALASPGITLKVSSSKYLEKRTKEFETLIDQLTEKLPELRNFILPGGRKTGSQLHFARTISRRAERRIVGLNKKESVPFAILQYFNRLSDLLFTFARFSNYKEKQKEIIWKKSG